MGEGGEIGDGGALDAEEMQTGLPWQHLVEKINDGDQSIRAMDRAPAHDADTDKPGALDHMRERQDRKSVVPGKRWPVGVGPGGRRKSKKKYTGEDINSHKTS